MEVPEGAPVKLPGIFESLRSNAYLFLIQNFSIVPLNLVSLLKEVRPKTLTGPSPGIKGGDSSPLNTMRF